MFIPLLLALSVSSKPVTAKISIDADKPGIKISPDLYGIFFEEINCGGDGGLYAELVRNRSFEDSPSEPVHWKLEKSGNADGGMGLDRSLPLSRENQTSLRVEFQSGSGLVSAVNEGYWGIPVAKGQSYRLSLQARASIPCGIVVSLEGKEGRIVAAKRFDLAGNGWQSLTAQLQPSETDTGARLAVSLEKPGTVWLDMVSLFPDATFKGRKNGLRGDLAQMLDDLHPSFMRFPGGCWVEGDTMPLAQDWKRTIGPLGDRRTQYDLWQYMSTNGLGFHEYLQLCEDMGAAPLFVINCGMAHHGTIPMDQMQPYVQDALDAIEYANGPTTSKWGALRAENGHPGSFHLKYLEIGNEDGGPAYDERFPLIANAVKKRYPDIQLIANVWGGYPKGPYSEIVDEHYYSNPQFFIDNADKYDHYDRKGPQIYVGEYACTEGCGGGNLIAAVSEAAFMTGMERNSDVVRMASYAPLFANVNHKTWNPDLINFDNHRALGTPSYYVQKMFSSNRGDRVLPAHVDFSDLASPKLPPGGVGVGTWRTQAQFKDLRVVSGGKTLIDSPDGSALTQKRGDWKVAEGTLTQTGMDEGTLAHIGGTLSNYTLTLKARKLAGDEGFLISFGLQDDKNFYWWNIGGWGNTRDEIEHAVGGSKSSFGQAARSTVETGRWYDVKVEYSPDRVRCYLDGKLVHDVSAPKPKPLQIVASRVDRTGDVLLKVVNSGSTAINADIELNGLRGPLHLGGSTLTSASPLDENSLENPTKVVPHAWVKSTASNRISMPFPAWSVSVVRVGVGSRRGSRQKHQL